MGSYGTQIQKNQTSKIMILIHNGTIVTADKESIGSILVDKERIAAVMYKNEEGMTELPGAAGCGVIPFGFLPDKFRQDGAEVIDAEGKYLMAGGIDAHVHFRDPGLTHKADMTSESRAAAAGGVTTVMDMPNTSPATTSIEALHKKAEIAAEKSVVNVKLHFGATNSNLPAIKTLIADEPNSFAGIKVFLGSSTGNMLVDSEDTLNQLFSITEKPVLVHCEDEMTIRENLQLATEKYGEDIPFTEHSKIRSRKACIKSSIYALELAMRHKTKLTLCHISTKEEVNMVRAAKQINPQIKAETSANYLWFSEADYSRLGGKLKSNPAIKTSEDRQALRDALRDGVIDSIGSDHAPHLEKEKEGKYTKVPSGMPSIQFTLPVLLTVADEEDIPLTRIAAVFSENAADTYGLNRGKLKEGMYADIILFDPHKEFKVSKDQILSKCGWSPYEGETLKGVVDMVMVNGKTIIKNNKFTD